MRTGWLAALLGTAAHAAPLLVILNQDAGRWQVAATQRGWKILVQPVGLMPSDSEMKALEAEVERARTQPDTDRLRVYLAGHGPAAASVFYGVSRLPHLWAAGIAIDGSPKPAIDSNRLFSANSRLVPVIWNSAEQEPMPAARLTVADFRIDRVSGFDEAIEKVSRYAQEEYVNRIDCETGNAAFPRCYWLEVTRFDASRRNDVLPSTRVTPGSGAFLAVGGFGFDVNLPGPGLVVGLLSENYKGPLKVGDRIVSVGGVAIADARDYIRFMDDITQEKSTGIIVQRGKDRLRIETRILLPKREESITARIQAERVPDGTVFVISRGVASFRLMLPQAWIPAPVNWNGNASGAVNAPGCWQVAGEGQAAQPCL